jgi:hypothetical protein
MLYWPIACHTRTEIIGAADKNENLRRVQHWLKRKGIEKNVPTPQSQIKNLTIGRSVFLWQNQAGDERLMRSRQNGVLSFGISRIILNRLKGLNRSRQRSILEMGCDRI